MKRVKGFNFDAIEYTYQYLITCVTIKQFLNEDLGIQDLGEVPYKGSFSSLILVVLLKLKRTRNVFHFQYRKCKRAEELITKNKLLDACINGNGNIFDELKKLRKAKPVVATSMDGVAEDIPGHFRRIFKDIYNSADDSEDLMFYLKLRIKLMNPA